MRRALPAIAISAAGLTWLLRAQGVIDSSVTAGGTANGGNGAATGSPTTSPRTGGPSTTGGLPPPTGPPLGPPTGRRPSSTTTPTTASGGGAGSTTNGPTVNTEYGPVQVAAVISNGRIVDVKVLQSPTHARRSQQINERALPLLHDEVIDAQSADIDIISGATVTWDGYERSLQKALDDAGFH